MLNNNVVVKVCVQTVNGEPGAQPEIISSPVPGAIAKHNEATAPKCEASFPTSGATLELANTIKLLWPSVTAKPMKRHFQLREQPWDCQRNQTTVTKRDSKTYEMSFPMPRATLRLVNVIRLPVTSARIIFGKNCQHHRTRFSAQNRFRNARNIQTIGRPAASSWKQTCVDNSSNVMRPSTEGPPPMPGCPATPFQNFKIQIRINFTTRPSHAQGKQHLQKAWSRNLTIRRWERKLTKMNWMDGSMMDGL